MINNTNKIQFKNLLQPGMFSGLLLISAAILAIVIANSPLAKYYDLLLSTHLEIRLGELSIDKPVLLWINDGLMAVFFFLVGLELKREFLEGELSTVRQIVFPAVGAVGGMIVPALIYIAVVGTSNEMLLNGWAIPAATDIAFALGILALQGSRVPISLKVFLTSLAIFDDIGAIIIIAIFYTSKISFIALVISLSCLPILLMFNLLRAESKSLYIVVGFVMWAALLKSGVHATLAGIVLAFFIPMRSRRNPEVSPVKNLEHDLHSTVSFIILPIFAFTNAGIDIIGLTWAQAAHAVPVGVALGLLVGKPIGVFGLCWLSIKLKIAKMPDAMTWGSLFGCAALCGVGFTMSLFIGSLAFGESGADLVFDERLGIIVGSILSGIFGYWVLNKQLKREEPSASTGAL